MFAFSWKLYVYKILQKKNKPEVIQNIAESDYTYMWILDKRGIDSIRMHSISISQSSIMWKETEKLNI